MNWQKEVKTWGTERHVAQGARSEQGARPFSFFFFFFEGGRERERGWTKSSIEGLNAEFYTGRIHRYGTYITLDHVKDFPVVSQRGKLIQYTSKWNSLASVN